MHDLLDKKLGNAIPYGVYDIARNLGWVSVSVNHDTTTFAVNTTTNTGLKVRCALDTKRYRTEVKVSDEQMSQIRLEPARFHGD